MSGHGHKPVFFATARGRLASSLLISLLSGCYTDMYDQPRYEPLERSDVFDDQRSARPVVAGTIPFGAPASNTPLQTGQAEGQPVTEIPITVTREVLRRGQERFNIFCSNCHSRLGDGNGMIVQRGYRRPPTFHSPRLRGVPIGHFFDVMSNGFGAMPSYASQVPVDDRWAIAAYVRALQLSQYAGVKDLTDEQRAQLEEMPSGGAQ
jgi:mono/diheme cytochrome c family protein